MCASLLPQARIIDTPGLADSRGLEQDELHKANIATQFKEHIDYVTAVLIITNGTVTRLNAGVDYALTTLSTLFPKTLAPNIAFVFTNIQNAVSWNFSRETISRLLEDAPRFFLDNPCALQKRSLELRNNRKVKTTKGQLKMRKFMENSEEEALETLVELFDWLDSLIPQPTKEIVNLYNLSREIESMITDALAQMDQAAAKKDEIKRLMDNPKVSSSPFSYMRLTLIPLGCRLWLHPSNLKRPPAWSPGGNSPLPPKIWYAARSAAILTAISTTRPISPSC